MSRPPTPPPTPFATVLLLGTVIALPALGTDIYVPALPALATALGAPVSAVQFTLTTYFIGLAAGQLLWGPLSDRYGRRPILLAGLATMLVASVAALFMHSVAALAATRLLQGLGMSSGALIGRTIVRDLCAHEAAARLLARMTIVFSIVPIAAPLAGAAITGWGDWHGVFGFMALVALVLLLLVVRNLGETAPADRRSMHPAAIVRTFASILGDRRFVGPYLLVLSAQVGILAWVSSSAFPLVRGLGISTVAYGAMFALVMLGQITGAWASSRLVLRTGIARLLRAGASLMLAAGLCAAVLAWAGVAHWLAVIVPFMLFLFGSALVMPNATAAALSPFPSMAGSASSLIGALGFGVGAGISTLLGATFDGSAGPLATVALVAGAGAFFFERCLARGKA